MGESSFLALSLEKMSTIVKSLIPFAFSLNVDIFP